MPERLTKAQIIRIALRDLATNIDPSLSSRAFYESWMSNFGLEADMCAAIWIPLSKHLPISAKPKHLLWTLFFYENTCHNKHFVFGLPVR